MAPPMSPTTLYDVLELRSDASGDDVRKAWQRLARQHHPDQGGSPEAMARVNQAYQVLSDSHRRTQYDLSLRPAGRRRGAAASLLAVARDPRAWLVLLAVCATAAAAGWAAVRRPWVDRAAPGGAPSTFPVSAGQIDEPLSLVPSRQLDTWPRPAQAGAPVAPAASGVAPVAGPAATGPVASAR